MIKIKSCFLLLSIIGFWINDESATVTAASDETLCVYSYNDLQTRILSASTTNYTRIDLCTKRILLESHLAVSNKWIDLRCRMSKGRCTLDAQNTHGLVIGEYAHLKTNSINFINGAAFEDYSQGSANNYPPMYFSNSYVIMKKCSIMNSKSLFSVVSFYSTLGDVNQSLLFEDVTFINNDGSYGEVVTINGLYYSIVRSRFSKSVGNHLKITDSNGKVLDTVFENGVADRDNNVKVSSYLSTSNWTTVFKNTTFIRNGQQAFGATLSIKDGTNVILDDVVFRENYGTNITLNNTIMIGVNTATLKCFGKTKFCDMHFRIIGTNQKPYKGSTSCFKKEFITGC